MTVPFPMGPDWCTNPACGKPMSWDRRAELCRYCSPACAGAHARQRIDLADPLAPARGIVTGLALVVPFWLAAALVVAS